MTAKEIGDFGERAAARYLFWHGYRIVARNYRAGKYETDIICTKGGYVVFAEVKTRNVKNASYGAPSYAVDADKMHFLTACANAYLSTHPTDRQPRIDIVEVLISEKNGRIRVIPHGINHIVNVV